MTNYPLADLTPDDLLTLRGNLKPKQYLSQYEGLAIPGTYLILEELVAGRYDTGNALAKVRCGCGRYSLVQHGKLTPRNRGNWHPVATRTCNQGCSYCDLTRVAKLAAKLAATESRYQTALEYSVNRCIPDLVGFKQGYAKGTKTIHPVCLFKWPDGTTGCRRLGNIEAALTGKRMLSSAKRRATEQNVPFDEQAATDLITQAYQPGKTIYCAITGEQLLYNFRSGNNRQSPSLDKVIPHLGYVAGNLMIVSQEVNIIKSDCTTHQLKNLYERCDLPKLKTIYRLLLNKLPTLEHPNTEYSQW